MAVICFTGYFYWILLPGTHFTNAIATIKSCYRGVTAAFAVGLTQPVQLNHVEE